MAAGQGFKTFTTGEVLTAGDVNGYLMQGINVFTNATARNAAITAPAEGQFAFTKDNNSLWYYDGAAWVASGATGDIEGVTAGVGISGGGTSGTVTVTNSMATAIDAKGDLVPGTGADTFSRLAVGANGTVLTADSAEATGLKWATPASGAYTSLASGSITSSVSLTSISGSYTDLYLVLNNCTTSVNDLAGVRINNDTSAGNYVGVNTRNIVGTGATVNQQGSWSFVEMTCGSSLAASTSFNSFVIYFPSYAITGGYVKAISYGGWNNNLSTFTTGQNVVTYKTNAAITRLDLVTAGSSFASQGTYTLYGVK